ncbi:hypothetical protein R3P38DRAFT_1373754 [Favolaschia claudopus]|uniref:F-box domain-containing protein n=1 Tax=Favolaschia claudopus TaxID=2862362 RepID=A0AAW0DU93_9AGAR
MTVLHSAMARLQDVGEDLLIKILSFCDVYTVLLVSRVDKFLHQISLTKQLWVHLLRDLGSRGLIRRPSEAEIDEYSTRDIMHEIKRIVCGPETWAPESIQPPTIHRQVVFHPGIDMDEIFGMPLLIPGGTHAILQTSGFIGLYEVQNGKCIWQCIWQKASERGSIGVDLIERGQKVRVAMVPGKFSPNAKIMICEIDLHKGESLEVFSVSMPMGNFSGDLWWCKDLRGEYMIIHIYSLGMPGGHIFVLVNWRQHQQIILTYGERSTITDLKPRLLPNHLLVTCEVSIQGKRQHSIVATAYSELDAYWHPLNIDPKTMPFSGTDFSSYPINPPVEGKHVPISAMAPLEFEGVPLRQQHACQSQYIHESPIRQGVYKILSYTISTIYPRPAHSQALLTFEFAADESPQKIRHSGSYHSLPGSNGGEMISYAGYTVRWTDGVDVVMDMKGSRTEKRRNADFCVMKASRGWQSMYFSAVNGAVLAIADGSVVVSYYK